LGRQRRTNKTAGVLDCRSHRRHGHRESASGERVSVSTRVLSGGAAFARATRTREGSLFISGTASIVGHKSEHVGDVTAQLEETLRNLAAVKNQTQLDAQRLRRDSLLKVYVRDPQHARRS